MPEDKWEYFPDPSYFDMWVVGKAGNKDLLSVYRASSELGARSLCAILNQVELDKKEVISWESTTPCYIKYITDSHYRKFSPRVRSWYKPYRCTSCALLPSGDQV